MKNYVSEMIDLRSDGYLNPTPPEYRPVGNIQSIIIHHDAATRPHDYDSVARYRSEAALHYANLGPGIQYHFKIDNVGQIFHLRDYNATLWHASNLPVNRTSLAICVDGYFHSPINQQPTREQLEALNQLLDHLCTEHPEFPATTGDVYGHRQVGATACPGDIFFPYVDEYRRTGDINIPSSIGYDWPTFQPAAVSPVETPPQPTPPSPPVPEPTPPPKPPVVVTPEVAAIAKDVESIKQGQVENAGVLKQILAIVQAILAKLTGVFQ